MKARIQVAVGATLLFGLYFGLSVARGGLAFAFLFTALALVFGAGLFLLVRGLDRLQDERENAALRKMFEPSKRGSNRP